MIDGCGEVAVIPAINSFELVNAGIVTRASMIFPERATLRGAAASLAAASFVLRLFGIGYAWLIFIVVAALAVRDVLGATLFPLRWQSGTVISIIVTSVVYFAYFLNG